SSFIPFCTRRSSRTRSPGLCSRRGWCSPGASRRWPRPAPGSPEQQGRPPPEPEAMSVELAERPETSRRPRARALSTYGWALAGLTVLAASLRFSTLGVQSFWHDEAVTVGRILRPSLFDTLKTIPSSEATPPLYYVLAWGWTKVFGLGEVGVRSLSALFGTALVPV